MMLIYKNGEGYSTYTDTFYENKSIGNLGYSSVQCTNIPVGVGKLTFECPYGTITTISDYGVQPAVNGNVDDTCVTTA
jgi:hypothetical protein